MMSFLTADVKVLRKKWMKFYVNLMALKSHDEKAVKLCEQIQLDAALFNEKVMKFFEEMEEVR